MFDENGNLTRTWVIFFERIGQAEANGAGPYQRTLLIKNAAVGDNIADVVPVYVRGGAVRVIGVLRTAITEDLVVRIRYKKPDDATIYELITLTIPAATAINTPVTSTTFVKRALADKVCLIWDITASDNSTDAGGVASVTLQWE
jgi:hypothetical protein